MQFLIKLAISLCIIILCTQIGRQQSSLAGLISVMPITSLIVLLWRYSENPEDFEAMVDFSKGALWGILPSILFFLVAFICFRKRLALWMVLSASFAVWLIGAYIHQRLLR